MLGQPYSVIRGFVRSIMGDTDTNYQVYPDEVINGMINWIIVRMNSTNRRCNVPVIAGPVSNPDDPDDEESYFGSTLDSRQLAFVTIRCALGFVAPIDDSFSYRVAPIDVRRSGGAQKLYLYLMNELSQILDGGIVLRADNELQAIFGNWTRMRRDIYAGIRAIAEP